MRKLLSTLLVVVGMPAAAQGPAVRPLSAPDAESPHAFGLVSSVRLLANGTLLVDDVQKRQVTLLDPALASAHVVVDSAAGSPNYYAPNRATMIAYLGDSTLLVDPIGRTIRVLDAAGKIARAISPPSSMDVNLVGSPAGKTVVDARGRLIYRGPLTPAAQPGSLPIIRTDLPTSKCDTLADIAIPKTLFKMNLIPVEDDWAFLVDESIAIVRHEDYHVDFIDADGKRSSGPKIPHEWQHLSEADKLAVVDSLKRLVAGPNAPRGPDGRPPAVVEASELPDNRPAFRYGSAVADADDNLWIQTTPPSPASQIYDVVNRRGELVDRIEVPARRRIVGFGKGGVVYLTVNEPGERWIERRHVLAAAASRFVAVDHDGNGDVKLEVLDWGGTGRPLVLLAGLGNTAHVFERFAPELTPKYHVYAITRRGFGVSSVPATGYSADRLGDDVLAVIDSLHLRRPVLAGHSIAGQELSSIGSRHPEKVAGLIYLDAAYAYAFYDSSAHSDVRVRPTPGLTFRPPPGPTLPSSPAALAIARGFQEYTSIRAPALAIYAYPKRRPPGFPSDSASLAFWAERQAADGRQADAFERGVPGARVVRIPYADHAVFESNPADVLREMNAFIASLPPAP